MRIPHSVFIYTLMFYLLLGLAIFLKGFFPIKQAVAGYSTLKDILPEPGFNPSQHSDNIRRHESEPSQSLQPLFDRLVLVLIDALRADFVLNTSGAHMHGVAGLIRNGGAKHYLARAHPPTVTMPRIKALTSGSIPGFVDVVLNFDSKELHEDNLVEQFHLAGKKTLFFGDDTWIKLFPGRFHRSDGTTSFFVSDYTEVDNNVTRHISPELGHDDWDVMILHYLGLDHIGHLAGPSSPLVQPKLDEMDKIVVQMQLRLAQLDKTTSRRSLLVLCGDHGMSEQGSHGGSSHSETATPLVMFGAPFQRPASVAESVPEIYQIDMVPSLSLLLGLPIPKNSLGVIQPDLFESLDIRQRLRVVQVNADQLIKTLLKNCDDPDREPSYLVYQQARHAHSNWLRALNNTSVTVAEKTGLKVMELYIKSMYMMRSQLTRSLSKYDMHGIIVGITTIVLVLFFSVSGACGGNQPIDVTINLSTLSLAVMATSVYIATHIFACTSTEGSDLLCRTNLLAVVLFCLLSLASFMGVICLTTISPLVSLKVLVYGLSRVEIFLFFGTLVHTFSLLSSSFVEEEHQTWYFLTVTLMLIVLSGTIADVIDVKTKAKDKIQKAIKDEYEDSQQLKGAKDNLEIKTRNNKTTSDAGMKNSGFKMVLVTSVVVVLVCCRLLRAWNQTGIKFAEIPDIGDWLIIPHNKNLLSILVGIALGCVVVIEYMDKSWNLLTILCVFGVYCHRAATGALSLPGYTEDITKGIFEARVVYILLLLYLVIILTKIAITWVRSSKQIPQTQNTQCSDVSAPNRTTQCGENHIVKVFSGLQTVWLLLSILLLRPLNIPMFALVVIQERLVSLIVAQHIQMSTEGMTLLYLWFGQASFYYQGNSNSIATVDVSAGYVGLSDYQPVIVSTLLLYSTYAGPIYWLFSLGRKACEISYLESNSIGSHSQRYLMTFQRMSNTILISRALPLAVYTILVTSQRFHLFVWTVFSPKLLYEAVLTFVLFSFQILLWVVRKLCYML